MASVVVGSAVPARRWPVLKSLAGYRSRDLGPDLLAGLTLAAVAIPEQMATARLGGLPPQLGFFAFIAASLAFLVFGSSRRLSVGADSTTAPIFAGGLAVLALNGSPHYAAMAAGLGLMVGVVVAAAGLLRMGWIGNLLSLPVTYGFLAGIAIHIAVSQLPAAMGVGSPGGDLPHRLVALVRMAPTARLAPLAVAVGVLATIWGLHRISQRLPGPLIAVGAASLVVGLLHLDQRGVALLGPISGALPSLGLPGLDPADWTGMIPLALLIAVVVMVQTSATSRSFPRAGDAAPDVDGDFVGVGIAGLFSGLAGAFPVNASPPRTAIVAESGGVSQIASLTAAALMALLLIVGTGALAMIPRAALSGVLLFVAVRIVRADQIRLMIRQSPAEVLLVLATAIGIVVLPIEAGVALGIGLSVMNGLWGAARAKIRPMRQVPGASIWWPIETDGSTAADAADGVIVLTFQAPLTFLNADGFSRQLLARIAQAQGVAALVVLEAAGIVDIDFTAAQALRGVIEACRKAGIIFALARLESVAAQSALSRLGLKALIGEDHIFASVAQAVAALGPATDGQRLSVDRKRPPERPSPSTA